MNIDTEGQALGKREANKNDRRQAIVEAATRSFLEDGYAATSMSGLLKTLGGSKATLWSYFRSKEELFAAVIEDLTAAFRAELEGGLLRSAEIDATLTSFCSSFMRKMEHPDSVATRRLIMGESGRFPEVGQIFYERAVVHVQHALTAYIRGQIAAGSLRDESPEKMAQLLIGLCATRHNERLWGGSSRATEDVEADARRFAGYFLRLFGTAAPLSHGAGA